MQIRSCWRSSTKYLKVEKKKIKKILKGKNYFARNTGIMLHTSDMQHVAGKESMQIPRLLISKKNSTLG